MTPPPLYIIQIEVEDHKESALLINELKGIIGYPSIDTWEYMICYGIHTMEIKMVIYSKETLTAYLMTK